MDIETVELVYQTEDKSDTPNFVIHYKGTTVTSAFLARPENRHYQEVADWYKAQKKKPFKFTFEG